MTNTDYKQKVTDGIARVNEIVKELSPTEKKWLVGVGLILVLFSIAATGGETGVIFALFVLPVVWWLVHLTARDPRAPGKKGWYKDPDDPKLGQRYWDGQQWTEHLVLTPPDNKAGVAQTLLVGGALGAAVGIAFDLGGGQ